MPVHACLPSVSQKTVYIIHIELGNNSGIGVERMGQEKWNRNGLGCGREAVKDKVCVSTGTWQGMGFFIKARLFERVGERKEQIKDAATEKPIQTSAASRCLLLTLKKGIHH